MADANIASAGIVREVLTSDNYLNWSAVMKNYLIGKKLWDLITKVDEDNSDPTRSPQDNAGGNLDPTLGHQNHIGEGSSDRTQRQNNNTAQGNPVLTGRQQSNIDEYTDWPSRNAQALHAIQLSCGNYALGQIRDCESAKKAWNHLKCVFSEDLKAEDDIEQGGPQSYIDEFHVAVKKGLLEEVKDFINRKADIINQTSTDTGWNSLHVAVDAGQYEIMKVLVEKGEQQIKEKDWKGYTPVALAAKSTDDTRIVELMLNKVGVPMGIGLLSMEIKIDTDDVIDDTDDVIESEKKEKGDIPLLLAATKGHKNMTEFLFGKTEKTNLLVDHDYYYGAKLLSHCIQAEIFDVAEKLLRKHDEIPLTYKSDQCVRPIYGLAHIPTAFPSGTQFRLWEWISAHLCCIGYKKMCEIKMKQSLAGKILKLFCGKIKKISSESELHQWSVRDAMLQAAKYGIVEFINEMKEANPDLLWVTDSMKRGIFAHAILNRQSKVFKHISEIKGQKGFRKSVDMFGNNLLHLAAELGPSSYQRRRSNAALQMQRDLKWFKAVESIVPMMYKEAKNADGLKPREVFTKNHGQLIIEGRKWAKETASSFTIVGTLIITIMFAAAFTVPGGNDQAKGTPFFLGKDAFSVFILADALSLITSSSSVLTFIGILTSRYAEEDFLWRLPLKLLFALFTIFLSVLSMMVAFSFGLALMLKGYRWMIITGMASAIIPIIVLLFTLMRLFCEICHSWWSM